MALKELIKGNEREVKDVFYLIALQGLNYLAPIVVLPYLMVVLGAEKFGCIGFALAVCQYLMIIVDFGFNLSATKRIALAKENPDEVNKIFSATFYAKILLLVICFIILTLIALIPRFEIYRPALFVMFTIVIGNTFLFVFLFQGLGQIRWISIINCIAKLSILPLTFVFVKQPDDYLIAAFLQGFVSVAAAIISICLIANKKWVKLQSFDWDTCKNELQESMPIFLSNAATTIYTACFVIILGIFATPSEVGEYSATDRIIKAITYMIFIPVSQAFFPKISSLSTNNIEEAVLLIKRLLLLVSTLCLFCGALFFSFSNYIQLFLGETYNGTETLFRIMAFVPFLVGTGGVFAQLVILALGNENDKIYYRNTYIIAGVVALLSVLALSYKFFATGAAVSLLLTEFTVTVLMGIKGIRILKCKQL